MDNNLVKDWLRTVWGRRPGALTKKSLLVLNTLWCHKTDMVKKELCQMKSSLAVIPGEMTIMLQPLDVLINKPMKTFLRKSWNDWYSNGAHTFTAGGKMSKPDFQEISKWIADAWFEIDPAIIVCSFKKCCISNNMDDTEDDIIWEDSVRPSHLNDFTEKEDDNQSYYTVASNGMTDKEIQTLFDKSNDDKFEGFWSKKQPFSELIYSKWPFLGTKTGSFGDLNKQIESHFSQCCHLLTRVQSQNKAHLETLPLHLIRNGYFPLIKYSFSR